MNVNAAIIDQRLSKLREDIRERALTELRIQDEDKLKSTAFVFLAVKTVLDLTDDEAFDCLTEGGQDFGVDALHLSEEHDKEFTVSLFQGKYKKNLKGDSNFPESGIKSLIQAVNCLFDPNAKLHSVNPRLQTKIEETRSLIRDGYIPQVRAISCNNGLCWTPPADEAIERAEFGDQVSWEHVNHDQLVNLLQATKPVNETLPLTGKAIIEDFNFSRVLVGKMAVTEIAELIEKHGERLLERNIRRYLGLQGNRINLGIRETLKSDERANFYFYNNGITFTCEQLNYNALQKEDYQVKVKNLQIINGGQTCMTIFRTLINSTTEIDNFDNIYVLIRLYQLPSDNEDLVKRITYATNSQNPVYLKDLRSNDEFQKRLETDITQLGYNYHRKRKEGALQSKDITSGVAAEAVLSVWRQRPHQAKFFARGHFGKLYDEIFNHDLNGAQVIIATLIYRYAENKRKRPPENAPAFVRYGSCFIAMQMGKRLLNDLNCDVSGLSHKNFKQAQKLLNDNMITYYENSVNDIEKAIIQLYGHSDLSMQQLAATFRRGDLIEKLENAE